MKIRDRVRELRRVAAGTLAPNPRNWRTHPEGQRDALQGVLAEIGYADALLVRELDDGRLRIVDGHLRAETTPDQEVPVLILDIDDAEEAKLLATLDPIAAMATANKDQLGKLLHDLQTESDGLQVMLDDLAANNGIDRFEAGGHQPAADPEPQVDRAAKLRAEWGVEPGQLWEIEVSDNVEPKDVAVALQRMKDMGLEPRLSKPPAKPKRKARPKRKPKTKRKATNKPKVEK